MYFSNIREKLFKDSTFSPILIKDFTEIFQNSDWEKYTFQCHLLEGYGYFCKIVITFLGRNAPNNKFLKVTIKETNKVMYHQSTPHRVFILDGLIGLSASHVSEASIICFSWTVVASHFGQLLHNIWWVSLLLIAPK